jgi:hypothetical protein
MVLHQVAVIGNELKHALPQLVVVKIDGACGVINWTVVFKTDAVGIDEPDLVLVLSLSDLCLHTTLVCDPMIEMG